MAFSILTTVAVAAVVAVVLLAGPDWWRYRKLMLRMKKLGKPMLSWNILLGNLITTGRLFQTLPVGAHSCYMLYKIARDYFPSGAFYFDVWPLMDPMLVITDHEMANQAVLHPKTGARKPGMLKPWMHMISGGPNLFNENGEEWQALHNVFKPAFSVNNVNKQVPLIISRIETFRAILQEKAQSGERVLLQPIVSRLIADIIGETLLHIRMDNQRTSHPLAETMAQQIVYKEQQPSNPEVILNWFNPFRRYGIWKNSRLLDESIKYQLMKRFEACKDMKSSGHNEDFRSVIDLVIEEYLNQPGNLTVEKPDAGFVKMALQNLRMFFFVGGSSTAGITVFCYHNLQKHPETLAKLRAEHNAVLGADVDAAPRLISKNSSLLSSLPYTQAILKESLRLFPMADGIREGSAECEIVDAHGNRFPTDGFSVVVSHLATQTNPKHWVQPLEFLPERWMVEQGHELYPPPGSWRPFEFGTRACLGQQSTLVEVKAILACTAREFDFRDCYSEIDGDRKFDLNGVFGERAYMVEAATAYPAGNYPCKISFSGYRGHGR